MVDNDDTPCTTEMQNLAEKADETNHDSGGNSDQNESSIMEDIEEASVNGESGEEFLDAAQDISYDESDNIRNDPTL